MELAIFVVLVLGISAGIWAYWDFRWRIGILITNQERFQYRLSEVHDNSVSIMNVLTEASRIKAQRAEAVFDKPNDKIPASGNRYIPVARRRAVAEAQSAGPANHDEQLRRNNAKVMETL